MEQLHNIEYIHGVSYPGMCKKTGIKINNIEYLLKFSETKAERINLCSENLGIALCNQISLKTSDVKLVLHDTKLCLLSKKWEIAENEQYFPLASFYEELIDVMDEVPFTYELFKLIIKRKAPKMYDEILNSFWGVFIIDFLICNYRSAGNIGFLHDGEVRLSPIFDCSTALESCCDERFKNLHFPSKLMDFGIEYQSSYSVLLSYPDEHKDVMLEKAKSLLNIEELRESISCSEEEYIINVISYRYKTLFQL